MKLDWIEFGLENCEVIRIDGKYICDFCAKNFSTEIARYACNDISKEEFCNSFIIEISKSADKEEYKPFGSAEETSKFKRLTEWNDITSIEFELSNQYAKTEEEKHVEHYYYYVDYDSENDSLGANNINQKSYISELGNLYIVIEKDKDIEDYFNKEDINDQEYVDFGFEMCDVE